MRDYLVLAAMMFGVVAGCSVFGGAVTEDNYFEKSVAESCKLMKDCNEAYFWSEYDDINDCIDTILDDNEDAYDYLADECDFDEDNAADCLAEYQGMKCENLYDDYEDIYDACSEVWDCE